MSVDAERKALLRLAQAYRRLATPAQRTPAEGEAPRPPERDQDQGERPREPAR